MIVAILMVVLAQAADPTTAPASAPVTQPGAPPAAVPPAPPPPPAAGALPTTFFTLDSFKSFGGVVTILALFPAVWRALKLKGELPPLALFLIAIALCVLNVRLGGGTGWQYALAIINGMLVFLTVVGGYQAGSSAVGNAGAAARQAAPPGATLVRRVLRPIV